ASSPNLEYVDSSPNLEYFTSLIYTFKYSTSSYNSEETNLSLNDSKNINDTFDYPDSSDILTLQNAKKHKSVFVASSNKIQTLKKAGTSMLGSHLRTVHCLLEKGSLLPLSGISEQPVSKKTINIAQKDSTQPMLIDTLKNKLLLSSKKKDRLTSRLLAWIVDDIQAFNILENEKFCDFSVRLLAKRMIQNVDRDICKDGKRLETLLLNEHELLCLKELVYLLEPFAKATYLMAGDTYPTLSLMLLTIATLQEHLFKIESTLTHSVVYPRFKNLEFASEKFEETKTSLRQQMRMLNESKCSNDQPTAKPSSNLASFFNNATPTKKFSPIETEIKAYFDLSQMTLYDLNDLEYKTENPLSWW
ncbi:2069_t:CDS:2, partial [Gigaspora rosea]